MVVDIAWMFAVWSAASVGKLFAFVVLCAGMYIGMVVCSSYCSIIRHPFVALYNNMRSSK